MLEYTKEEVESLLDWAMTVDYSGRLDIGGGQVLVNTQKTVQLMAGQIRPHIGNVNYLGMIHKLNLIRQTLEAKGLSPDPMQSR